MGFLSKENWKKSLWLLNQHPINVKQVKWESFGSILPGMGSGSLGIFMGSLVFK